MKEAPLYRDTLALCGVLLEDLDGSVSFAALRWRLCDGALRLLDAVALALGGFERTEQLLAADAELRALRAQLHLAFELELLEPESFFTLAEQADLVGRQVGGWLAKLRRS